MKKWLLKTLFNVDIDNLNDEIARQRQLLDDEIARHHQSLADAHSSMERLQRDFYEKKDELRHSLEEIRMLRQKKEQLEKDNANLENFLHTYTAKLQEEQQKVSELIEENKKLKVKLEQLNTSESNNQL